MQANAFANEILKQLSPSTLLRLQLRQVKLEQGSYLELPGDPITTLYFPEDALASRTAVFRDGAKVEIGMMGRESVIGKEALLGIEQSAHRVLVGIAGSAYLCRAGVARAEFERVPEFQRIIHRYIGSQLQESAQLCGCSAGHELQGRLCRWLLLSSDRTGSEDLDVTHEFLAETLCARRSTITLLASDLRRNGAIAYKHGKLKIVSREVLQQLSCECYDAIRGYYGNETQADGEVKPPSGRVRSISTASL